MKRIITLSTIALALAGCASGDDNSQAAFEAWQSGNYDAFSVPDAGSSQLGGLGTPKSAPLRPR